MWIRKLPWIVSGLFAAYLAAAIAGVPSSGRGFELAEFGRLPVVMSGGVHAMDTAARISLRRIRGTDRIPLEPRTLATLWRAPRELSATEWLLEVLTLPDADTRQIFAVRDRTLVTKLGLRVPAGNDAYYTFAELQPSAAQIAKEAKRIEALDPPARAGWEREWLGLRNALVVYTRLKTSLQPNGTTTEQNGAKFDFAGRLARYQQDLKPLAEADRAHEVGKRPTLDPSAMTAIRAFAAPFAAVSRTGFLALVPPDGPRSDDAWQTVGAAIVDSTKDGRLRPAVAAYARISSAYEGGQVDAFNREIVKYRQWLRGRGFGRETARARAEFAYYRAQPFTRAAAVYFAAFVLMCVPAFRRHAAMRRCAMVLVSAAVVLHGVGLLWLMVIARGLPPLNGYIVTLTTGLGVAGMAAAATAFGRRTPLAVAPAAALIAMAVAQGSLAGALQLARDAVDVPFVLALAASLLLFGLALTDDGVLRIAIRRSSLANQPSA